MSILDSESNERTQNLLKGVVELNNLGTNLFVAGTSNSAFRYFKSAMMALSMTTSKIRAEDMKDMDNTLRRARSQVFRAAQLDSPRSRVVELSLESSHFGSLKSHFDVVCGILYPKGDLIQLPIRLDISDVDFVDERHTELISSVLFYNLEQALEDNSRKQNSVQKTLEGRHKLLSLGLETIESSIMELLSDEDTSIDFEMLGAIFIRFLFLCRLQVLSDILGCPTTKSYCKHHMPHTTNILHHLLVDESCIYSAAYEAAKAA